MGSCGSPIELNDDVPFIKSKWIGQSKKFTNVPDFVQWKKDKDMKIPLDFLQCTKLPEQKLSVTDFVAFKLPWISSEIITNKVTKWFSKNPPIILDPQILLRQSIPSPAFLNQLEEAIGQAWLDGVKSIIDWRINDGADCLPLWIITFWKEAERLNRMQSMWIQSMKWLSVREPKNPNAVIPSSPAQNIVRTVISKSQLVVVTTC